MFSFISDSPVGNFRIAQPENTKSWYLTLGNAPAQNEAGDIKFWSTPESVVQDVHSHRTGFWEWDKLTTKAHPNTIDHWARSPD